MIAADADSGVVVGLSTAGHMICARTERGGRGTPTFGTSGDDGPIASRLSEATAACGSRLLDTAALRPYPIEALCPDVDDEALMLCRAVQRRMREGTVGS